MLFRSEFIHTRKTAALIRASLEMGAIAAGAGDDALGLVGGFGSRIGLAFQVVDDILDIVSTDEVLGKDVGSDEDKDKATYPKVFGLERSKEIARGLVNEGKSFLEGIDRDTEALRGLADFVVSRVY